MPSPLLLRLETLEDGRCDLKQVWQDHRHDDADVWMGGRGGAERHDVHPLAEVGGPDDLGGQTGRQDRAGHLGLDIVGDELQVRLLGVRAVPGPHDPIG